MAADDLIDLGRAQQHPGLRAISATRAATLITSASLAAVRYCKRTFVSASAEETYDGDGTNNLLLDRLPITALAKVVIVAADDSETEILGTEFRKNDDNGLIQFSPATTGAYNYFPSGFRNIKVTYTAGYASIPENVQEAVVLLAAWLLGLESRDVSKSSERLGDYAYSVAGTADRWPGVIRDLLSTYRDMRV